MREYVHKVNMALSPLWKHCQHLFKSQFVVHRTFLSCSQLSSQINQTVSVDSLPHDSVLNHEQKENEPSDQFSGCIPIEKLKISYSRSSGPGGQNVNKVNTKVDVRFHVASADWIPDHAKEKLLEQASGNITKDGHLIVTSEKTRKQLLNQADCLEKIRNIVRKATYVAPGPTVEDLEIMRNRKEKANRARLREKKAHSMKKQSRNVTGANL